MGDCCGGDCESGNNEHGCCEDEHSHEHSHEMSMGIMMMQLADDAWSELMMEKMKAELEKTKGAKMNKVAKIAVEAASKNWEKKMMDKAGWMEFEEKLKEAMK
ncbi:MAG: hypothetical protein ABIJ34_09635 [archaeon]